MSIPDDTMRRLVALKLGDKLEAVMEIIADAIEPKRRKAAAKAAKGVRLPEDWWPNQKDMIFAEVNFAKAGIHGGQAVMLEIEKFKNHWLSKAGVNATKTNWDRTWQNWVINSIERRGSPRGGNGNGIFDVRQQLDDRRQRSARNPDLFDPSDG